MEKEEGQNIHILREILAKDLADQSVISVIVPNGPESSCIFFCVDAKQTYKQESGLQNEKQDKLYQAVAVSLIPMNIQLIKTDFLCTKTDLNGIIVAGNNGTLFSTIKGEQPTIIHQLNANLPKRQARGNMSSVAFARLRMQSRQDYIVKITQTVLSLYIHEKQTTIDRLFIGAIAPFSKQMMEFSDKLKQTNQLYAKIIQIQSESQEGLKQVQEKTVEQRKSSKILKHSQLFMTCPSLTLINQPIVAIYGRNQAFIIQSLLNLKDFTILNNKSIMFAAKNIQDDTLSMSFDQEMLKPSQKTFVNSLMKYILDKSISNQLPLSEDISST